jgi:hypothetical protein
MIIIGIFVGSCIGKKEMDAIYLLISTMVACVFPFFAWGINEVRMKFHANRRIDR